MGIFDFLKGKKKESGSENGWERFVDTYKPAKNSLTPSEQLISACKQSGMPEDLIEFIKFKGFGNYGDGLIKVINPEDYMTPFYTWLGQEDYSKIPFMMTGFGDIIYFRNLGDGHYDISYLDIHYRKISVIAYNMEEFWSFICLEETQKSLLRLDLFQEAKDKCGALQAEEIYYFVPALILGGAEKVDFIDKGNAAVHQQILFELGNS